MGLFTFIKEAGEKLFGHKEAEQAVSPEEKTRLNQAAAQAGPGQAWATAALRFELLRRHVAVIA